MQALEWIAEDTVMFRSGLLPLLELLGSPTLDKPAYKKPLAAILKDLATECRGVVLDLCLTVAKSGPGEEEKRLILWFCTKLAFDHDKLRQSKRIQRISRELSPSSGEAGSNLQTVLAGETIHPMYVRNVTEVASQVPGGRHDNDHRDFRQIDIVPTEGEFRSTQEPYLPRPLAAGGAAASTDDGTSEARHLDRQFRLLRQDMVGPMIDALADPRKRNRDLFSSVRLKRLVYDPDPCFILSFSLPKNSRVSGMKKESEKSDYWKQNTRALPKGALVCLVRQAADGQWNPIRFGVIKRREPAELALGYPEIGIQFTGDAVDETIDELSRLVHLPSTQLMVVSSSFFAFKPVLEGLKSLRAVPFRQELVHGRSQTLDTSIFARANEAIQRCPVLRKKVGGLDTSQKKALICALERRVALVQGPPGTGKTYIGALVASLLLESTDHTILVVCYTNHALDSFLENLLDDGITDMVRVGGRSKCDRLEKFNLYELAGGRSSFTSLQKRRYGQLKREIEAARGNAEYWEHKCGMEVGSKWWRTVEPYIEEDDRLAYAALHLSANDLENSQGFARVGANGAQVKDDYLWCKWLEGKGPAPFNDRKDLPLWRLSKDERVKRKLEWQQLVHAEHRQELAQAMATIEEATEEIRQLQKQNHEEILRSHRIIGITTTKAAMEKDLLDAVAPGIVLVEEAAEILEAHVLTSISPACEQLVMIGDHKQLRPKCEHYPLTVASGRGHDLNRSLFERLAGSIPLATLTTQHRMHPDISAIAKAVTYPDLVDAESVSSHPKVRGLSCRVVFVDHHHAEDDPASGGGLADRAEAVSKTNSHEVDMVVATVKYLLQQGYGASDLVVLTPYLGQLLRIQKALTEAKLQALIDDADLGEAREKFDGVAAFDVGAAAATAARGDQHASVRVATIDNYQGEEANVAVISLVRGADEGSGQRASIGFLKEPERVNVLFTRAKHGMVVFGNRGTLERAGGDVWQTIYRHMEDQGGVYQGLPVQCSLHHTPASLATPGDFARFCPLGGCKETCKKLLPGGCGHRCALMCHPAGSCTEKCVVEIPTKCARGIHDTVRACSAAGPKKCRTIVLVTCAGVHGVTHEFRAPCHVPKPNCARCDKIDELNKKMDAEMKKMHVDKLKWEKEMEERKVKAENKRLYLEQRRKDFESKMKEELEQKKRDIAVLQKERELKLREENSGAEFEEKVRMMHEHASNDLAKLEQQIAHKLANRARQAEEEIAKIDRDRKTDLERMRAGFEAQEAEMADVVKTIKAEAEAIKAQRAAQDAQVAAAEGAAVERERDRRDRLKRLAAEEKEDGARRAAAAEDDDPAVREELAGRMRECLSCKEKVTAVNGLACHVSHFLCDFCFDYQVGQVADLAKDLRQISKVGCFFCSREGQPSFFTEDVVRKHTGKSAFEKYERAKHALYVADQRRAEEKAAKKAAEKAAAELQATQAALRRAEADAAAAAQQARMAQKPWSIVRGERKRSGEVKYAIRPQDLHDGADSREQDEFNFACGQMNRLLGTTSSVVPRVVTQVDVYSNELCEATYASMKEAMPSSREVWVFHGTGGDGIEGIMQSGFRVAGLDPGAPAMRNGNVHGRGVYTATGPNTPMAYSNSAGTNAVILAKALEGNRGRQEIGDCWAPRGDWLVFKTGEQLLPKYVVHWT